MRKAALLILGLLFLAGLPAANIRQSPEGAEDLSVGDRFELRIKSDVSLDSVVIPDTISNFHVFGAERISTGPEPAWLKVTLAPLFPGSHSFPRLEVIPDAPDGNRYFTDRFRLNIIPVRAAEDTLLVGVKPLAKYPWQPPAWVYPLLALLLAVSLILCFILARKKRESSPPPEQALDIQTVTPDPAWKTALKELDELEAEELPARGEHILHHYRLSHILRKFLERKYRFAAVEMTTSEIRWVTQRVWVENAPEVIGFLQYCDRVKFARHVPGPGEIEIASAWLRGWLREFEVIEARSRIASGGGGDA